MCPLIQVKHTNIKKKRIIKSHFRYDLSTKLKRITDKHPLSRSNAITVIYRNVLFICDASIVLTIIITYHNMKLGQAVISILGIHDTIAVYFWLFYVFSIALMKILRFYMAYRKL